MEYVITLETLVKACDWIKNKKVEPIFLHLNNVEYKAFCRYFPHLKDAVRIKRI